METNKYFQILSGDRGPVFLADQLKIPDAIRLKNVDRINIVSGSRKGQFIKSGIGQICDISGCAIPTEIRPSVWNEDKNNRTYIIPNMVPALKAGVVQKDQSIFSNEMNISTDVETEIEGVRVLKRPIDTDQLNEITSRLFDVLGSDQIVKTKAHIAGLLNVGGKLVGATMSPKCNFRISGLSRDEIVNYLNSLSMDQLQRAPGGILWPHPILSSHIEEVNEVNKGSAEFDLQYFRLLKNLLGTPLELVKLMRFLDTQGSKFTDQENDLFHFLSSNSSEIFDENQFLLGNWIELINIDGKEHILRGATPLDYDQLSKIAVNNFLNAPNYVYLRKPENQDELNKYIEANSPGGVADLCSRQNNICNLVIEHNDQIVGFRVVRKCGEVADGRRMHTSLEHTCKGIGSILLTKSEQIAKQAGCTKMEIHATGDSYSWFEKKGFVDQGIRPNGISQFHLMVKNL